MHTVANLQKISLKIVLKTLNIKKQIGKLFPKTKLHDIPGNWFRGPF